jgi:hypothetical protein
MGFVKTMEYTQVPLILRIIQSQPSGFDRKQKKIQVEGVVLIAWLAFRGVHSRCAAASAKPLSRAGPTDPLSTFTLLGDCFGHTKASSYPLDSAASRDSSGPSRVGIVKTLTSLLRPLCFVTFPWFIITFKCSPTSRMSAQPTKRS